MSKCNNCNKKGLFFKVNTNGICKECERIVALEIEEKRLKEEVAKFQSYSSAYERSYNEMREKRAILHNEIVEQAKQEALKEVSIKIEKKNEELQEISIKTSQCQDALYKLTDEVYQSEKMLTSNANKLRKLQTVFKSMQYSVKKYFDDENMSKAILTDNVGNEVEELLSTTIKLKLHLMDIRELRKLYNQNNKVIRELLTKYQSRYTNKTNAIIYKLMVIALEAELQNVLYNISYSKLDKAINDIKMITAKYAKIATNGNQQIAPTINRFIGEIEYLFIEAIKTEYEYYVQKERIKEEQKAIREQMRQEAEERKILEQQRKQVEKEEEKYENEIANVQELLSATDDELKIKQLEERLAKIQAQLEDVERKKEDISKLQNGKAGYIYVISNLGSFGDNVFKVGMTRRQNPQDRIDELGDASVPFYFDVHSFVFSNNAPELENNLHKQLHNNRINKVNLRKEFFNTTIDELEELVLSLEPTAEFNRTMLAEQYYQSLSVEEVPDSVSIVEDNISEDDD